jgi:hypothetical protein
MKFISGIVLGAMLTMGGSTMLAQNGRELVFHPRLARAIEALRDARAYLLEAPHDFGGHKAEAIRATDNAIRELDRALQYRERRR